MQKIISPLIIFVIVDFIFEESLIPYFEKQGEHYLQNNIYFRKLVPLIIIIFNGMELSLDQIVLKSLQNSKFFLLMTAFSLILSISTVIAGIVESKLFLLRYQKRMNYQPKTKDEKRRIVKFEGLHYVKGKGVYDYSADYMKYAALCNVLGSMVVISFLLYLKFVPGFLQSASNLTIIKNDDIRVMFTEIIPTGVMVFCFWQIFSIQKKDDQLTDQDFIQNINIENPSTYTFKRWHVHLNLLHFWYTSTISLFLVAMYMDFLYYYRPITFTPFVLLPVIFLTLFSYVSANSKSAKEIDAVSQGTSASLFLLIIVIVLLIMIVHKKSISLFLSILFFGIFYIGINFRNFSSYSFSKERDKSIFWMPIMFLLGITFLYVLIKLVGWVLNL
ncbi:hypothetical protein [Streptococcus ovis]|uniref:hypothetical protein n=1 Tax=Streptococcus ovis TaxID=82806 RepID=UPI000379F4E5|nr:hypothetical protein [Streptococcus ovis]